MTNHYYRMPVKEWQRFQLHMTKMAADAQPEVDVRALERKQALAKHRKRITAFKQFVEECEKSVSISDAPCTCERNHFSIILKNGKEYHFCPVTFWLNMCQTKRLRSTAEMKEWAQGHPFENYLRRIDPDKDGTYEPNRQVK